MSRLKYLDTFRGIAVITIILFHLNLFKQGLIGVEIFFIISGYIITFLLIKEQEKTGGINLKKFYIRRISRITPLLLLVIVATVFMFINLPIVSIADKFFSEAKYATVGLTNWYEIIHNNGYWENGVQSPLLHMWTLAIETQFYLVYPILVKFFFRWGRSSNSQPLFFIVWLAMIIVLFSSTVIGSYVYDFNTLYYSTIFRISSFLIGALFGALAYWNKGRATSNRWKIVIPFLLLFLLSSCFELNNMWLFRGIIILYNVILGYLFLQLHYREDDKLITWFSHSKLLLFFGTISYSLYLWHIPIITFINETFIQNQFGIMIKNPYILMLIQISLSIVLACITYLAIERTVKIKSSTPAILLTALLPLLTFFMLNQQVQPKLKIWNDQPTIDEKWIQSDPVITKGNEPLLVIGDSWSRRLAFGLNEYQERTNNTPYQLLLYGVGNASIMDPDYLIQDNQERHPYRSFYNYQKMWQEAIDTYHPKKVLMIYGFAEQAPMVIKGKETRVGDNYFNNIYQEQFDKLIDFFQKQHIEIYMTNIPNNAKDKNSMDLNKPSDEITKCFEKSVSKYPTIHVLDLKGLLSDGEKNISKPIINNIYMYDETNHPSYYGSDYIGEWLLNSLRQ